MTKPLEFSRCLWVETAVYQDTYPCLQDDVVADVAIIGSGITGLSAAIHLLEIGRSVVVVDAQRPGWGASGRNGGQVNPGLKYDPDQLGKFIPSEMLEHVVEAAGNTTNEVFSLIDKYQIDCQPIRNGWVQAAFSEPILSVLKARVANWQQRGVNLRLLTSAEMGDYVGTSAYRGGLLDPRGGGIQPFNYTTGLARVVKNLGGAIFSDSKATGIQKVSDGFKIETSEGKVRSGQIVMATNGYTDDVVPALRLSVVPVVSIQVATEPLSKETRQTILRTGVLVSDARRLTLYYRLDDEGRFVFGGRGSFSERSKQQLFENLRQTALEMFPQLRGKVSWSYAWGGNVAMTKDHLPRLHEPEPGLIAGLGYNGRGVAMATTMGRVIADKIKGVPERELDFPLTPVKPILFHQFNKIGVSAIVAWYRFLDQMESRTKG